MDRSDLKILAIDDHEDNRTVLKAVLADAFPKAQVLTALNGREGIELALAEDPDVVLLDLVLPEMDGYEVCRTLKGDDRLRSIPVVILTALRTDRESRIKALEEGAEAFLSKPFDEAELIAQVRAMAKIKAANERPRQEAHRLAALVAQRTAELEKELAERRKAEQGLQQANQQLRQSQTTTLNLLEDLRREVDLRKRSEEESERQAVRAESYLDIAGVMMVVIEPGQKAILVNRKTCEVLGCEEKDILGRNWFDTFLPEKDRDRIKAGFNDLIAGKIEPWGYVENRLLTGCGEEKLIAWHNTVLRDDSGRIIATLSSGEDITERRHLEESLRASEERFKVIATSTPDHVLMQDTDLRYVWVVNPQLGLTERDMIGKTDFDFLGREEAETLTKIKREVLASGEPVHMEVPLVSLKGGIEYFDGSYVPQRGPDGKVDGLIGYFRNVTEHKRAEETLHEREEIYSSIVNQAADGIVLAEAHSGRFVEFNRAAHEGLGYSREEFAQLAVSDIDVGIGPENLHDHMAATFAQGQVVFDTCQRHRNGELRDVRVSVRSLTIRGGDYFAAIWSDITERKRAADTLRESEAHYRSLFDNMLNGFAYCRMLFEQDRPVDFTYLSVNLAFETLTGLKAVVGKNVSEVIPGIRETNPELIEIYGRVALSGRPEQFETYVEPLGMWFSISVYSPQKEHFVAVFDVITDRKQAQERLQVHQQQLRALASELSLAEERERRRIAMSLHDHTCQNLVLVRMKLDELLESAPAAQAEAFHGICNVLSDTIEDVRELTFDLSSPTLYKFGLEAALEELLEDKFGAEQDVEYDFSDDGESKPLTDDVRVLLFQSVREILINILKHARARNITLDIRRAEGSIRIAVTDDGVGFDVDEVSSLPARQRGFGLFSIKERLDCIGGSLEIDSQRGVGSQFTLVAPLKVEGHDSGRTHDVGEDSARG